MRTGYDRVGCMVQEHWWRDGEVAEGLRPDAQGKGPVPAQRLVDWDGPSSDEPCVPIIYEPL